MRQLLLLLPIVAASQAVVIRLHDSGLRAAANFTRQWLHMAMPQFVLPSFKQEFSTSFATGRMAVTNLSVRRFVSPLIRFRPTDHSVMYMSTMSGYAQVTADWSVDSQVLSMLRIPLDGQIQAQMTGLISEIAMQITPDNSVEMHHCVAQIRDLRLSLSGSMAAEVLHWFRNSLTRAIRKQLEQEYCDTMRVHWIPWVSEQLAQFPTNITISQKPSVVLTESPESVAMTSQFVEFRLRSDLIWDGHLVESTPQRNKTVMEIDTVSKTQRMVDIFVDEETVQSSIAAAHFADHLKTTIESPFLDTQCDVLCLGTVVPELARVLPNKTLTINAKTLSPPIIALTPDKALVFLNASLDVNPQPKTDGIPDSLLTVNVETEFALKVEVNKQKVKGNLHMLNAQATLVDSKVGLISQQTVDFLVSMSTPFLEDAVDMWVGRYLVDAPDFPTTNEILTIHRGFLRYEVDLNIPQLMNRLV
ncbi:unnamed protein product, partial [Mesorhabditis belari]|uniref:Lipid-binding serum glycoprotein C-terminal domain-containing protein n=1 Tax=Mesorhabditis belari TaxID=2138241 RepID=A0AAF3FDW8_9BILA